MLSIFWGIVVTLLFLAVMGYQRHTCLGGATTRVFYKQFLFYGLHLCVLLPPIASTFIDDVEITTPYYVNSGLYSLVKLAIARFCVCLRN
jgi:hypothetical protein